LGTRPNLRLLSSCSTFFTFLHSVQICVSDFESLSGWTAYWQFLLLSTISFSSFSIRIWFSLFRRNRQIWKLVGSRSIPLQSRSWPEMKFKFK
jgi:hypothetical protein